MEKPRKRNRSCAPRSSSTTQGTFKDVKETAGKSKGATVQGVPSPVWAWGWHYAKWHQRGVVRLPPSCWVWTAGFNRKEARCIHSSCQRWAPGDPILGPIDQLPDEEFPDLPFQVFLTRFGGVYHLSRSCRHLASVSTGLAKESKGCSRCRRSAYQNGSVPALGATLFLRAYGSAAHSDMRCPTALGSNHLQLCTACLETKKSTAWAWLKGERSKADLSRGSAVVAPPYVSFLHLHISNPSTCQVLNSTWCVAVFFFKGPVAKLCPPDRAAKQGEKLEEQAAAEAWIRRRLGILGGWAWWSTRASSIYIYRYIDMDIYIKYINLIIKIIY